MGAPLPFTRRGRIVFPAILCSSRISLLAELARIGMLPGEEPSQLARPGITLPLPPNFGAVPFANPDIFFPLSISLDEEIACTAQKMGARYVLM